MKNTHTNKQQQQQQQIKKQMKGQTLRTIITYSREK